MRARLAGIVDAAADAGEQRHAARDLLGDRMNHFLGFAVVSP